MYTTQELECWGNRELMEEIRRLQATGLYLTIEQAELLQQIIEHTIDELDMDNMTAINALNSVLRQIEKITE